MFSLIAAAFGLGIAGSLHCLGMCGPLVISMPFQQARNKAVIPASILYHIGKTVMYAALGLVAGSIGKGFSMFAWQQGLSIVAGVALLLLTFLPSIKRRMGMPGWVQRSFARLYASRENGTPLLRFMAFGLLNGLLPCGLVYAALAAATVTAHPLQGMLFMAVFGLGTTPSLTAVIFLQGKISTRFKASLMRTSYYLSILIGILLILRGFNLGIPYLSPKYHPQQQEIDCCQKP